MRWITLLRALLLASLCVAAAAADAAATGTRPGPPPASRPAGGAALRADAERVRAAWAARFAAEGLNHLIELPFVIAGDGSARRLEGYRDQTVRPALRALNALYFKTPPRRPVLVLLFEEEKTYRRLSREWFGQEEVPHFGYYLQRQGVMVMNVSTGAGTLVHEMVHALIAPDFPAVPDWFNEGLASLYEQSTFSADGRSILGLPNWRLPALQQAIRANTLPSLRALTEDGEFRHPDRVGLNYAAARYLMLYLQEKQLLSRYYHAFRDAAKEDPTGWKTLTTIAGPGGIDRFEREWRAWVLTLER